MVLSLIFMVVVRTYSHAGFLSLITMANNISHIDDGFFEGFVTF